MSVPSDRIGISVVGYGYWGPNIVRNILERPELHLCSLCELDDARSAAFSLRYPGVRVDRDFETLLIDPRIEAVSIATPPRTHHSLARRALEAGKHVLVEKPLATNEEDAIDLIELAAERGLTLMPGHTFLYSPPVNRVRDLILGGVLGDPYFVTSSRMNLGIYQPDGVICDLAPHDLSILMYWLGEPVVQVVATGRSVFQSTVPETAFLTLTFPSGTTANIQISWLAPRKVRQMVVVGSRRMVQYEDTSSEEPIRVYDRGLDFTPPANFGEYQLTYRSGDMVAPRLDVVEPLSLELQDFANAIRTGEEPRSNGRLGLEIVRTLVAADESLASHGEPIELPLDPDAPGLFRDPLGVGGLGTAAHVLPDLHERAANGNGHAHSAASSGSHNGSSGSHNGSSGNGSSGSHNGSSGSHNAPSHVGVPGAAHARA
jgi:predicted dehydrogenase